METKENNSTGTVLANSITLSKKISYSEKINAEYRIQSNSALLTKYQLENVTVSVQINQNKYKIDCLKGEITKLKLDYRIQEVENVLTNLQVFGPAIQEAINYSPNLEYMVIAFFTNLDPQSFGEYISDIGTSYQITQQDISYLKMKNNKEIKDLKSINKGLNAEYKENEKQINIIKTSIQDDIKIVEKWRIENGNY